MLRLLALGLQGPLNDPTIKSFLYLSCYKLSLSSDSAGCSWWAGSVVGWCSCLSAHLPVGSQEGQIGLMFFLLGLSWLLLTHRKGKFAPPKPRWLALARGKLVCLSPTALHKTFPPTAGVELPPFCPSWLGLHLCHSTPYQVGADLVKFYQQWPCTTGKL